MVRFFSPSSLLITCFALTLVQRVYGQGARRNGRDNGQLEPVEPGSNAFDKRNNTICNPDYREVDGTCTNDKFRAAGSASTSHFSYFNRLSSTNAVFDDLPSPRLISNVVCSQSENIYNDRGLSEFVTFFAQFLDHTIVGTELNFKEPESIPIPSDDPLFLNFSGLLKFHRSERAYDFTSPGRGKGKRIELPMNILSSAIDLASVYGANPKRALDLREGKDGLMKTSSGNMLPLNNDGMFNAPSTSSAFFVAGDHRANEHPVLTTMHTIFLREHNLLATELKSTFPSWDDEELYQMARKINIAQFQKIVYEEFFTVMTGRKFRRYKGFRPSALPAVSVLFSTAAYRIGHTMVGDVITRRGPGMTSLPSLTMEEMFFNQKDILAEGIEPFARGAMFERCQEIDTSVFDSLRNFLFTNVEEEEGVDLIALNLQRSRDHALPSYNEVRKKFKTRKARKFSDITSNQATQNKLSTAYGGSIDAVEPWIGLMAEDHMSGSSMGPTLFAIWDKEFSRLRDGDRFFYKIPNLFGKELMKEFPRLKEIYNEKDTMAQIILRNTDITSAEIGQSVWIAKNI